MLYFVQAVLLFLSSLFHLTSFGIARRHVICQSVHVYALGRQDSAVSFQSSNRLTSIWSHKELQILDITANIFEHHSHRGGILPLDTEKWVGDEEGSQVVNFPGLACFAVIATRKGILANNRRVKDAEVAGPTSEVEATADTPVDRNIGSSCVTEHAGFQKEIGAVLIVVRCR